LTVNRVEPLKIINNSTLTALTQTFRQIISVKQSQDFP